MELASREKNRTEGSLPWLFNKQIAEIQFKWMTVRNVFAEGSTSDQYRENWPPLGLAYETFDDIDKHENVCVVQEQQC